jgi:LacI family transcriptional regulator
MKTKITLKKIAKEFDVSISTVSKALKDSHEISEEVREKIKAFAAFYHYKPNSLALNLRNQKTKTIGVIIPEIVHHFFSKVISGIEKVANANVYNVMICVSNESYEKEVLNMEMLANGIVDGILISVSKDTEERGNFSHFKDLISDGIPLVLFDRIIEEIDCNKIIVDDLGGGFLATNHLLNIGCNRIAILTTPDHVSVGLTRKKGYLKALEESNVSIDENLILKVKEKENIAEQIERLFMLENPPDGIFAVNEEYAAIAIKLAKKHKIKVPRDLSVIGFTDGVISEFSSPSLTTVAQHGFTMGEKAMELLLDEIEHKYPDYPYKTAIINTDLKIRESTKKLKQVILK